MVVQGVSDYNLQKHLMFHVFIFNLFLQGHREHPQFEAFVLKSALWIIMPLSVLIERHGCFILGIVTIFPKNCIFGFINFNLAICICLLRKLFLDLMTLKEPNIKSIRKKIHK
jgi:hypothetical protein